MRPRGVGGGVMLCGRCDKRRKLHGGYCNPCLTAWQKGNERNLKKRPKAGT